MKTYTHGRTCVYNINYHFVWCVKYHRKVLSPVIESRLQNILYETGHHYGFTVAAVEVGERDHVHCFVSAPPKISISEIIAMLKSISARRLFAEFPHLRKTLWGGNLWSGSYFVETVGSTSEENVRRYIENQANY